MNKPSTAPCQSLPHQGETDSFWESNAFETDTDLPSGWMRVRDTTGTYYWHIPTGTTQWEAPSANDKLGDCVMSSSMSLETTPCEEPELLKLPSRLWTPFLTRRATESAGGVGRQEARLGGRASRHFW
ncbi:hypothetical protein CRUP_026958 [Coryphaenoides rupestris]|nr:hypothetical protein CRUP_026958 [Coryphaenoides rupestris]